METFKKENNRTKGMEEVSFKLIPKHDYRIQVRKYLEENIFKPNIKMIKEYVLAFTLYFICFSLVLKFNSFPVKFLSSVLMGFSLATLTFFLHEVLHGAVTSSQRISYILGASVGVFNLFPPFFWKRIHNFHHAKTGDIDDPDRSYVLSEKPKTLIEKIAYKTRMSNETFNPILCFLFMSTGFFWYFGNAVFSGLLSKTPTVKYQKIKCLFKENEKILVLGEMFVILCFQGFLFFYVCKSNFLQFSFLSIIPVAIAHFIAMLYIHTNHFLSPLTGDIDDPLINSLSIKNSKFTDAIFLNFSHHVEHHLFPSMSSHQYPKVRKILQELYPDRFKLIPMKDAIKLLFNTPRVYNNYSTLISLDGKQYNALLPNS